MTYTYSVSLALTYILHDDVTVEGVNDQTSEEIEHTKIHSY